MSKHLLFVLHGMGVHPDGWSTGPGGVQQTLIDAAQLYPYFRDHGRSLTDYVQFVELAYDSVFERWRQKVGADAASVVGQAPPGWQQDVLGQLAGLAPNAGAGFGVTHALDVALYRLLPNVHNEVLAELSQKILTTLQTQQPSRVSVLTHSLGTSVAHDTLAFIAEDGTKQTNPWHCDNFQLTRYFTVANVSRILQTRPKVLSSPVRPGPLSAGKRYVRQFYNFTHLLDPFPRVKRFDPLPEWQDDGYEQIWVHHLLDLNVHGYTHYLEHPKVHATIINALMRSNPISDADVVQVLDNEFRRQQEHALANIPGIGQRAQQLQELADQLVAVPDPNEETGVREFLRLVRDYFG